MPKTKSKTKKDNSLLSYYGFTKAEQKKYPVISRILKQLTPEKIKREIESVQKVKLPPELQKWVKEYEKVGERDEFVWKWIYKIDKITTFFSVPRKYLKSLWEVKFLISMFVILLDDVADKIKNKKLLDELLNILSRYSAIKLGKDVRFDKFKIKEDKYLKFTTKLWNYIWRLIRKYPKYNKFKDIFEYDIAQIINSMNYACLINKNPYLINKKEYWSYFPPSMQGMIHVIVALMCSSKIKDRKIRFIREIIWEAQKMVRIGNWITTWEREIKENDITSGVFAYAIDSGIITLRDLEERNELRIIKKIKSSKIEKKILEEWEKIYHKIEDLGNKIKTINVETFLLDLEKLLVLEISSRSYK